MWTRVFIVVGFSLLAVTQAFASDGIHGNLLGRWFFHVISRGFYLILISMIFVCFVISAIKSKVSSACQDKSGIPKPTIQSELEETDDYDENRDGAQENLEALKDKLRQAEELIYALRNEIGETQNRTVSSLEVSVDEIDRSRSFSKDEIINTQLDISMEIENMRHENAVVQRQLDDAKTDNTNLIKQIEVLQREARISEAALRDQQNLSDRLKGARSELDGLKSQLQGIKVERDTAVRIAAEHIYKMTPDMTPQKIEVIEAMIDAELRRVREEEEAVEESCKTDYDLSFMESNDTIRSVPDTGKTCTQETTENHRNPVGDAPSIYTNQDDEPSNSSDYDSGTQTTSYEFSFESGQQSRIVTRSPAFRAFLQNVFRQSD
ncbi:hypothetical protein GE061_003731 [Apolygus lucorum]|uniref:Uncharacterized protein n=1 Tax=Apolygus lucorum TaxID=248454 RepID=A0A8S9X2Y5_APOLU|nr:hypothetical protein GE061_003731 [Apolygus lucorum]